MKTRMLLVLTLGIVGNVIANPVSKQTIQSENKNSLEVEISDSQTKQEGAINLSNKGDLEQKKDTTIANSSTTNNDFDEKVEIIIEEDIVSPIGDYQQPLPERVGDGPQLIEFNEDGSVRQSLPESTDDSAPQLPDFITDSPPQLSGFIEPNLPQLPEFFEADPKLQGFQSEFMNSGPVLGSIEDGLGSQLPGEMINGPQLSLDDEDDLPINPDYFREDMPMKIEHEIMETAAGFIPTPLVFRRKQKPRRRFATRRHFRRNPYRRHQFFYPYYYAFYRPSSLRYY